LQELHRDFAGYDQAYREFLSAPFPVRTTVGSDLMNILVEIDFVVAL
jgi:enamine deaminase RidA (YjgF/YER057c/UK114 family)